MRSIRAYIAVVLVAFLLVLSNAALVSAQGLPAAPYILHGTASMLDAEIPQPAPDGAEVFARVGDYTSGSVTVSGGRYVSLQVTPPDTITSGTITFFMISGGQALSATETYPYVKRTFPQILTVNLTFVRTTVALGLESAPPEMVRRGDQVSLSVTADLGSREMASAEVQVNYDPQVFKPLQHQVGGLPADRTEQVSTQDGSFSISWGFTSPTGTPPPSGMLVRLPLQVRNSAPSGGSLVDIQVDLTDAQGNSLPLEPADLSFSLSVTGIVADFNGDGEVNLVDLAALGMAWGGRQDLPGFEAKFDLDDDGVISDGDLAILVQNYGRTE